MTVDYFALLWTARDDPTEAIVDLLVTDAPLSSGSIGRILAVPLGVVRRELKALESLGIVTSWVRVVNSLTMWFLADDKPPEGTLALLHPNHPYVKGRGDKDIVVVSNWADEARRAFHVEMKGIRARMLAPGCRRIAPKLGEVELWNNGGKRRTTMERERHALALEISS